MFPERFRLEPKHFCPVMASDNPAVAGHVWVCAPPFRVVDLTVALQPYEHGEERHLGPIMLAKRGEHVSVSAADLFDPDPQYEAVYGRPYPSLAEARRVRPQLFKRIERYGALEVCIEDTRLRYFACAITAPDLPLEQARNLSLSGKWPFEVWREFEKTTNGA
jgi:hypothetical protein